MTHIEQLNTLPCSLFEVSTLPITFADVFLDYT